MKFEIFSKQNIEKYTGDQPYILISVAGRHEDGEDGYAELLDDEHRVDVLRLKFDDITTSTNPLSYGMKYTDLIYFDKPHAKQIIEFVNKHKDNVGLICVNCYAGISRSAGIASALSVIVNGPRSDEWIYQSPKYYPNPLVYNILLGEHFPNGYDEIEKYDLWWNRHAKDIMDQKDDDK